MRVKRESENAGLKFSIKQTKIVAFSPSASWQIEGETVKAVTEFLFLAPNTLQTVTAAAK